ncbi:sigma-70 family RNA polymerase sigma factor [Leucobacter allii]|uniref:Sigma-70 family RNA polymerase sigma factor n=1 Tax=Leucobacter allii TaxID=2932247 RepID=A0ABY4FR70_9MICO|nr:sigma-70 family RNA polymerase sigma factor [Leucobacter allii]UOQ58783.1 sigma-70 family RNA polymerase sigma factor [Leucobacter allii]
MRRRGGPADVGAGEPVEAGGRAPGGARELGDAELCALVRGAADTVLGRSAFSELYHRHRDAAMAQAYTLTRDRHRAEDVVAEAFTSMLRALAGGAGPTESPLGYLMVSIRGAAARARTPHDAEPLEPAALAELVDDRASSFTERLAERDQVRRAFERLQERDQQLLQLLDIEELPTQDASDRLAMTEGALRVAVHRARKRLGTHYLQQYVEFAEAPCRPFAAQLARYTRGSLGTHEAARVAGHLEGCVACAEQVERLRRLQTRLRAWIGPALLGGAAGGGAAAGGASAAPATAVARLGDAAPAATGGIPATGAPPAAAWLCLAAGTALLALGIAALPGGDGGPPGPQPAPSAALAKVEPEPETSEPPPEAASVPGRAGAEAIPTIPGAAADRGSPRTEPGDDTTPFWVLRPPDSSGE